MNAEPRNDGFYIFQPNEWLDSYFDDEIVVVYGFQFKENNFFSFIEMDCLDITLEDFNRLRDGILQILRDKMREDKDIKPVLGKTIGENGKWRACIDYFHSSRQYRINSHYRLSVYDGEFRNLSDNIISGETKRKCISFDGFIKKDCLDLEVMGLFGTEDVRFELLFEFIAFNFPKM